MKRQSDSNPPFVRDAFDALAVDGVIGAVDGRPAYAYARVSTDEQAEEGRSGLPRQIAAIAAKAKEAGYAITWDRVYADDFSGFELHRPRLDALRREVTRPARAGQAVVIEALDRLSRNAEWHQGYLLHEFREAGIAVLFWKAFNSRIEQAVMGAIAQEGMEQARARMAEGTRQKARQGFITGKRPTYGYRFVDDQGRETDARKRTRYAIREDQAAVVRRVFADVLAGKSLYRIAQELTEQGIPAPQSRYWRANRIANIIHNETYKGDYYANRVTLVQAQKPTRDGLGMRKVTQRVERPADEWIHVEVPAIVPRDVWDAAQRILTSNQQAAARRAMPGTAYLLAGLVKCARCGSAYGGRTARPGKRNPAPYRFYECTHNHRALGYMPDGIDCDQPLIAADVLENAVWAIVRDALLQPEVLIAAIDASASSEPNRRAAVRIDAIEAELAGAAQADDRLYRAYMAGALDEQEYAARRAELKAHRHQLALEAETLRAGMMTPERLKAQKHVIIQLADRVRSMGASAGPSDDLKRRIIALCVDRVLLNVLEGRLTLEGTIQSDFVSVFVHNDCTPALVKRGS